MIFLYIHGATRGLCRGPILHDMAKQTLEKPSHLRVLFQPAALWSGSKGSGNANVSRMRKTFPTAPRSN